MKDDVLRKVGRNVVLFQQIESMLKLLISVHHNEGTMDTFAEKQQKRTAKIHTQTMGQLAEKYKNGILSDCEIPSKEPEDLKVPYFAFTFRLTGDSDFLESQQSNLEILVNERNALIHHFLPKWKPDSQEAMVEAALYLDRQREKVIPLFDHLKSAIKSMDAARDIAASFFTSTAFEEYLDTEFQKK